MPAYSCSTQLLDGRAVLATYHRQHLRVWFPQSRLLSRQELATDNFRMRRNLPTMNEP
jgi:hypothetical protein